MGVEQYAAVAVSLGAIVMMFAVVDMGMNPPGNATAAHITVPLALVLVVIGAVLM